MTDFWTKRRAAVEAEAENVNAEAQVAEVEAAAAEKPDEEVLEELGLPDPETLEAGDDFKGFMNGAVPERLKQRALRRLWRLNPVLANVDGLVDYGEDFTDAATVIEGLQTTYQVGKGMLAHVEEMARKAEADEMARTTPDEDPETEDDLSPAVDAEALTDDDEVDDAVAETAAIPILASPLPYSKSEMTALQDEPEQEEIALHPPRRRMQFEFLESPPA